MRSLFAAAHPPALARALGFWAALLAALLAFLFAALALAFPALPWAGIADYAVRFQARQMASFIPALLLAPTSIAWVASLHVSLPPEKRVLSLIALALMGVYTTMIVANYYAQLFVVRLNLLAGELEGLAMLAQPNFHSAFAGTRLKRWVRALFIANGALGLFGAVLAPFDRPFVILASLGFWCLIFPAAMLLTALWFRRDAGIGASQGGHDAG